MDVSAQLNHKNLLLAAHVSSLDPKAAAYKIGINSSGSTIIFENTKVDGLEINATVLKEIANVGTLGFKKDFKDGLFQVSLSGDCGKKVFLNSDGYAEYQLNMNVNSSIAANVAVACENVGNIKNLQAPIKFGLGFDISL